MSVTFERSDAKSQGNLVFHSIAALERGLDGGEDRFADYFFAIYHCTPDEPAGVNQYRQRLRDQFPDKAAAVGKRFVLFGEPAWRSLWPRTTKRSPRPRR